MVVNLHTAHRHQSIPDTMQSGQGEGGKESKKHLILYTYILTTATFGLSLCDFECFRGRATLNTSKFTNVEGRKDALGHPRFATQDHTPARVTPLPSNMTVQKRYVTLLCIAEAL